MAGLPHNLQDTGITKFLQLTFLALGSLLSVLGNLG